MNPDPTDLREVMVSNLLDHLSATLPALMEYGSEIPDDVTDAYAIVDRIIADERLTVALSTPPANSHLVNGLYRNDLGAELHVTGGWITPMGSRVMSVGGIYVAESRDRLFGTVTYHVTPESMRAARYELIEASAS